MLTPNVGLHLFLIRRLDKRSLLICAAVVLLYVPALAIVLWPMLQQRYKAYTGGPSLGRGFGG